MTTEVNGMPVDLIIGKVKDALVYAGVSQASPDHDLRVTSVQLILEVVAAEAGGTGVTFRIPVVGMELKAGVKITRRDTHTIDITLVPPGEPGHLPARYTPDVEDTLVDAIETIRTVMTSAARGRDPWVVSSSTVDISFVVTKDGQISLGVEGELSSEVTQTLRLSLEPG